MRLVQHTAHTYEIEARNSSLDIGVLNMPHVPSVAPAKPSCDVAAVQSLSVTTLNPYMCCSMSQCVAVCCSVLQCVALYCSVLQ